MVWKLDWKSRLGQFSWSAKFSSTEKKASESIKSSGEFLWGLVYSSKPRGVCRVQSFIKGSKLLRVLSAIGRDDAEGGKLSTHPIY